MRNNWGDLRFASIRSALRTHFLQRVAVRYFEISDTGRVRRNNQDRILADEQLGLWIVADGMPLADAFEVAHSRVRSAQEDNPSLHDMGTTLVAVREHDGRYELAWVGDSRIYRYNSADEQFECLTRDQNVAGRLLETGRITEDQARDHPQRHILTDCIGQREGLPTIESTRLDWRDGDRLLLCSDGLNSELSDAEMKQWLGGFPSPRDAAEKLAHQALEAGGRDNISLIILDAPESA